MRQDAFFELAERLTQDLRGGEILFCNLDGEVTDFARINCNRIRQAGSLYRNSLDLDLIAGRRRVTGNCDLAGDPVRGLGIQLTGEGLDEVRFSGTAPTFGDGGYEFFLNGTPIRGLYTVQLLSQTGAPISEEFVVQTSPVCEENVAIVNFVQNHEF